MHTRDQVKKLLMATRRTSSKRHSPVSFAYGAGVDCARTVTKVATKTPSVAPLNMAARTPSRVEGEYIVGPGVSVQLKHTHKILWSSSMREWRCDCGHEGKEVHCRKRTIQ